MQRRLRRACTAIREHSAVGYAKIATLGGFCNVDLMVIKATSPDDVPFPEKYVHEFAKIISFSASTSRAFSLAFARRFGWTRCWRVALKCLVLLHRLLRSLPESNSFRNDLLWARSNGLFCLVPSRFRDSSSSSPQDYTALVRSYAHLLDEALDCYSFTNVSSSVTKRVEYYSSKPENNITADIVKRKEIAGVLDLLPQLQSLIDRVMECEPVGAARTSYIVRWAMKQILRDSFQCYATFCTHIVLLLDNLFQMQYRSSVSTMHIYKKAAVQASQLGEFYNSCRTMGLCGSYEYPTIDKIPPIHVRALESFLQQMWQLTESSSSTPSSLSTTPSLTSESPPSTSLTDELGFDIQRQTVKRSLETVIRTRWEEFDDAVGEKEGARPAGGEEEEPLIQLDDKDSSEWEGLLEASVNLHNVPRIFLRPFSLPNTYGYGTDAYYKNQLTLRAQSKEISTQVMVQPYDLNPFSPFYHHNSSTLHTDQYGTHGVDMANYTRPIVSPNDMHMYQYLRYSYPPHMLSPIYLPYFYNTQSPSMYPSASTPSLL